MKAKTAIVICHEAGFTGSREITPEFYLEGVNPIIQFLAREFELSTDQIDEVLIFENGEKNGSPFLLDNWIGGEDF